MIKYMPAESSVQIEKENFGDVDFSVELSEVFLQKIL